MKAKPSASACDALFARLAAMGPEAAETHESLIVALDAWVRSVCPGDDDVIDARPATMALAFFAAGLGATSGYVDEVRQLMIDTFDISTRGQ